MASLRRAFPLLVATALTSAATLLASPALAQMVTPQPGTADAAVARYATNPAREAPASREALIRQLREKVKYVFVIFNENHSFDNEFGTFPGANGLYADPHGPRDAAHTPGFVQTYKDAAGKSYTVSPFRIGPEQNATFTDSVDHSHVGLAHKIDVVGGHAKMDGFAQADFNRVAKGTPASEAMGHQFARLVMSHIDCDTIPFFWQYANRFAMFDNIFATEDTPSTPNAIAMLAGQAGETQWVKHGSDPISAEAGDHKGKLQNVPVVNDPQPFWGSQYDDTKGAGRQPDNQKDGYGDNNIGANLTFASVPLTLTRGAAKTLTDKDTRPATDLADVAKDIPFIAGRGGNPVAWRWYQHGYDHEPTDPTDVATHDGFVSHHEGPQYFGYIANNPEFSRNLRGLGDFFADMEKASLPKDGGVFYIRGGYGNINALTPPIQNANFPAALTDADRATIAKTKAGDDDHPSYTDRQISEAMAANVVNAVAAHPDIWSKSVILITYDESDGFYDHVPPRILSYGPDGLALARGVRIPMILISPYGRAHVVSHAEGDHNAVIETISALFNLAPLASLPEEKAALISGSDEKFDGPNGFKQHYLGPRDINSPITDDLLSGFDPARLSGRKAPLPASYAAIDPKEIGALPHFQGKGCRAIGMTPTDFQQNKVAAPPEHFNSLPSTLPAYN